MVALQLATRCLRLRRLNEGTRLWRRMIRACLLPRSLRILAELAGLVARDILVLAACSLARRSSWRSTPSVSPFRRSPPGTLCLPPSMSSGSALSCASVGRRRCRSSGSPSTSGIFGDEPGRVSALVAPRTDRDDTQATFDARGVTPSSLYFVLAGAAKVQRGETELSQLGPGSFVGEMSLVTGRAANRMSSRSARSRCASGIAPTSSRCSRAT